MIGGDKFKRKVVENLKRDYEVGSIGGNGFMFLGQRIRWQNKGGKYAHISVDQAVGTEELAEAKCQNNLPEGYQGDAP